MKKEYLKIETHRDGYAPSQCGETLTVRELIDYLEDLCDGEDDTPIYFSNDNGYTYGHISRYDIDWDEYDDDDE